MDSEKTNYIEILSSYLENENLYHSIKHYDNNSDDVLLVVRSIIQYKFLTTEKKYSTTEKKYSTTEEKYLCTEKIYSQFCKPGYMYKYGNPETDFKTVIFICIFTNTMNDFFILQDNFPMINLCSQGDTYYWTIYWSSDSERRLINRKLIEDVKNLVSPIYLKPAKRS
jgi:hypothetical protein